LIAFALVASAFSRQQPELARFEFSQVHMGMPVRVVLYAAEPALGERAARAAFARVAELDAMLSDYRPDSELSRLSATSGVWTPVSTDLFAVLTLALKVAEASEGAFDPTVGPLTTLWRETRETRRLPDAAVLTEALARVGWRFVALDENTRAVRLERARMRLDLGGIAKGYILQQALAVLTAQGTPRALVEAGGDIVVGDAPPAQSGWRVDVPHADASFVARAAALTRAALSTSGATVQFVEIKGVRYSHVIDPRTGLGVTHDLVVSVIAADAATADGLATAAGVLGASGAAKLLAAFPEATATFQRSTSPVDVGPPADSITPPPEPGSTHSVPPMTVPGVVRNVALSRRIHCSAPTVPGYTESVALVHGLVVAVRYV
jgi:thiamine biosynthesis lipoprotein